MSGDMRCANVPCDPLASHLASSNHLLPNGAYIVQPRTPKGFATGAILLCDLRRMAA